ncbi:MAG: MoxR family ATPase [Cryomorphaceae bacterium]|nr:MoxR family ATPase [Cryomorphaceae bacterium]
MDESIDIQKLSEEIKEDSAFVEQLRMEVSKVLIGQHKMFDRLLMALLANGHILLEGLPGLAKTLAIKTLAESISADFSRIQFTPDLLPSDVIGTQIYNLQKNAFTTMKGPIFANFVLADEINRAPAKVQSALLEAMQEKQVTIGDTSFKLPDPFLVLATQNPIDQEGTYPLPEAQTDRFMLKVVINYPHMEDERIVLRQQLKGENISVKPVVSLDQIKTARGSLHKIYVDEKIEKYILDIVSATRKPENYRLPSFAPLISFGASPRGSINLALAARVNAFIKGRAFVIPEDVREVALDVLRHRIGLTYEAEAEEITSEAILKEIINQVEVP